MNLRGIGANRTLVLVDGRRAQPANASLVVDLNTIPSAAIERVETITGGASAVYGADALAGVVNFVLKDDFEGVEMDFQTSGTAEGDGEETRFTSLIGVNSEGGSGNVMLGVEWYNREEVMQKDREFYRNGWEDSTNQTGGFLNATGFSPGQVTVNTSNLTLNQSVLPLQPSDAGGRQRPVRAVRCRPAGARRNQSEIYFQPDGRPFLLNGFNYAGPIMSYDVNGDGITGVHRQPNGSLQQVNTEALGFFAGRAPVAVRSRDVRHERQPDRVRAGELLEQPGHHARRLSARDHGLAGCRAERRAAPAAAGPASSCSIRAPGTRTARDRYRRETAAGPRARSQPWNIFRGIDFMGSPYSADDGERRLPAHGRRRG